MKEKTMDDSFRKRLQQRLHYGDMANLDVPSLPLTELAVDYFHDDVSEKLGHVDLYSASNVIRCNNVSPCSVVLSMLYAKRLRQQKQRKTDLLQTMSSADVFFISMMMASKYLYDEGVEEEVFSDVWADNTDQNVEDVNQMEIDFLQAMDWKLFVRPQEFEEALTAIERRLALQEGFKRGWYTYTEMDILMNWDLMWTLWTNVGSECSKLLSAISAAYLTSLLSMLGSTALAVHISGHLSSVTMSLLTLQSPFLALAVSSGMSPSLPALAFISMPSPLTLDDSMETNESQLSTAGFVASEESGSATWSLDGRWLDAEPDYLEIPGSESEGDKKDFIQSSDNGYDEADQVPTKSSLWSLWFIDSLVSQVWAVMCIKSKLPHFVEWSVSGTVKEPDRFVDDDSVDGFSDRYIPHFRRQLREQRTPFEETSTRKLTYRSRPYAHKVRKQTKTHVATQEVCLPADGHISSYLYSDCFSQIYPCQHSSQTSTAQCNIGHLNCQLLKSQSLSDVPKDLSSADLVIYYCQDCLTHHSKDCLTHNSKDCLTHHRKDCLIHQSCVNINPILREIRTKENNTQPMNI